MKNYNELLRDWLANREFTKQRHDLHRDRLLSWAGEVSEGVWPIIAKPDFEAMITQELCQLAVAFLQLANSPNDESGLRGIDEDVRRRLEELYSAAMNSL